MARILITGFCALPGPNRAGVQMRHIMSALSRHHSVDVLVMRRGEQAYVERKGACRILRVPLSDAAPRAQIEAFRRALRRQLESSEYDLVHVRDGWSGVPVLELRSRLEYAVIFDATRAPMADFAPIDLDLGNELARDEHACLEGADLVLVPGDAARSCVVRDPAERVRVVPPGVDVDQFDWDEPAPGPPVVLYAGSIEPGRGVRVLLRAMVYAKEQLDLRLVVAGAIEPGFRKTIKSGIKELGLDDRVELLGEVEHADMPALIARATVCVAPAAPDLDAQPAALYPTKLLEYMACRRAVVAPRRSSTTMLLHGNTHGLLFEPGDPVDLARALVRLVRDHDTRARLAEAGYQLVRQNHAASATRRAVRNAYRHLLGRVRAATEIDDVSGAGITGSEVQAVAGDRLQVALAEAADLADHTDEYSAPFEHRDPTGAAIDTAEQDTGGPVLGPVELNVGEITAVEQRPGSGLAGAGVAAGAAGAAGAGPGEATEISTNALLVEEALAHAADDEWVVAEHDTGGHALPGPGPGPDDEGTPVDGTTPAPPPDALSENRFVAGELEVPDRPRDLELELDEHTSFTAVGVLLGALNDDTDGAGRDEPG